MKIYEEKKKKKSNKKLVTPQMDQKGLFSLEKPLRMTDMCMYINSLKYRRRRVGRQRIAPTRIIRRDKKRRIRREE